MTVAEYLVPGWLTALRARRPGATVTLTAGNSAEVAEAVLSGAADLAGQLLAVPAEAAHRPPRLIRPRARSGRPGALRPAR